MTGHWLPVTVVGTADHGSYIIKVIGGAQYKHKTTIVNVTQMLSSLIYVPRLKWLDNLSPLSTLTFSLIRAPTAPTAEPSAAPTTPKQVQPEVLQQQPTPSSKTPATTDIQPLTGRTDVAPWSSSHVSTWYHNILLNRLNTTTMM